MVNAISPATTSAPTPARTAIRGFIPLTARSPAVLSPDARSAFTADVAVPVLDLVSGGGWRPGATAGLTLVPGSARAVGGRFFGGKVTESPSGRRDSSAAAFPAGATAGVSAGIPTAPDWATIPAPDMTDGATAGVAFGRFTFGTTLGGAIGGAERAAAAAATPDATAAAGATYCGDVVSDASVRTRVSSRSGARAPGNGPVMTVWSLASPADSFRSRRRARSA